MSDQNFYYLFPTVVGTFNLFDSAEDIQPLVQSIEQASKGHNGLISNGNRTSSSRFLDDHPHLKTRIQKHIDQYTEELGLIQSTVSYSWCNHYTKNGRIRPHRHELSVVSGAYYPYIDGYGGQLIFENPCNIFKINEVTKSFNEYNRQDFSIDVYPGLLVLFPSWLTHSSENNMAENRYVISFDTTIINNQ